MGLRSLLSRRTEIVSHYGGIGRPIGIYIIDINVTDFAAAWPSNVQYTCEGIHPRWVPGTDKIIFLGNALDYGIYMVNSDGTDLQWPLTDTPLGYFDLRVDMSVNGEIAFVRSDDWDNYLFVKKADGADVQLTFEENTLVGNIRWSPDGRYLVFEWEPNHPGNRDIAMIEWLPEIANVEVNGLREFRFSTDQYSVSGAELMDGFYVWHGISMVSRGPGGLFSP